MLKIKYVLIDTVKPHEKNPRKHSKAQIENLKNIINEISVRKPIEIDENNVILCGHARYAAFRELGIEKIPVIKHIDLSAKQKNYYRTIDNKIGLESFWDLELLSETISNNELFQGVDFDSDFLEVGVREVAPTNKIELKPYKKYHILLTCNILDSFSIKKKITNVLEGEIKKGVIEINETGN